MKNKLAHITSALLIILALVSCVQKLNESKVEEWLVNGDAEKLYTNMYNNQKVDKDKFSQLVALYSDSIQSKNLVAKPFVDESIRGALMERGRLGANYFDAEGNLHYSLTYRFVAVDKEGTEQINFIDFRSTDADLPCIKVPTFAPVRCIYTPKYKLRKVSPRDYIDSLQAIGPIVVNDYSYEHYDVIKHRNKQLTADSVKNTIVINVENNWVKSHFDILTKDLENIVNMDEYNLAYIRDISTPKLRIGFDASFRPDVMKDLLDYFSPRLPSKLLVTPLYEKEFVPMKGDVIIGHAYVERRKIKFW